MNIVKKIFFYIFIFFVVLYSFFYFYIKPRYVVPVLMYHGVNDNTDSTLNVSVDNFSKQISFLLKNGYNIISLDDLVNGIKNKKEFSSKTIVITFDDGLKDNYTNAFPILKKHNIPATIFLISSYMDNKNEYLTWEQVKYMMEYNIDFGGHTKTHTYLPSIKSRKILQDEILGSKIDIEQNINKEIKYFCYPVGGFNEQIKNIVKEARYKASCATNRGYDRYNNDLYEINRIKITNSDMTKPLHFRAKISGYYNLFRKGKRGY